MIDFPDNSETRSVSEYTATGGTMLVVWKCVDTGCVRETKRVHRPYTQGTPNKKVILHTFGSMDFGGAPLVSQEVSFPGEIYCGR